MGKAVRGLPDSTAVGAGRRARTPGGTSRPGANDDPRPAEGIGDWISRQRRLRGIALEDVARRTRIPRRSLERLEEGAFDGRPDGFTRGFVRTVATALGLDADDAVARMLDEPVAPGRRLSVDVGRALVLLATLSAMLGLAGGLWWLAGRVEPTAPIPRTRPEQVRRDAVRTLAREVGLLGEDGGSGGLAIDPRPRAALEIDRGRGPESADAGSGSGPVVSPLGTGQESSGGRGPDLE